MQQRYIFRLDFNLPVSWMEMSLPDNAGDQKIVVLTNNTDKSLNWKINTKTVKNFVDTAAFSLVDFIFLLLGYT